MITKEEEVYLSREIEGGEDIILDAICSVPYLIDYIINYREPLLNRERRVKELFKSFEDEKEVEDDEDKSEDDEVQEKSEEKVKPEKKGVDKRVKQVVDSFKALSKAKKDWLKAHDELLILLDNENSAEKIMHENMKVAFKKQILKLSLIDLGPTSKLINELVKAMETALKSDDGFEKELKRLEYKLPLFNDVLKKNHQEILDNILEMDKELTNYTEYRRLMENNFIF